MHHITCVTYTPVSLQFLFPLYHPYHNGQMYGILIALHIRFISNKCWNGHFLTGYYDSWQYNLFGGVFTHWNFVKRKVVVKHGMSDICTICIMYIYNLMSWWSKSYTYQALLYEKVREICLPIYLPKKDKLRKAHLKNGKLTLYVYVYKGNTSAWIVCICICI